jgi:hypothetical protein
MDDNIERPLIGIERARSPSPCWARHRNLLRRPHSPNKNRGRLQIMVRRAFAYADTDALTATEVYEFCKTMPQLVDGAPLYRGARWSIVRVLETIAVRVRKAPPNQAWIWRLRNS